MRHVKLVWLGALLFLFCGSGHTQPSPPAVDAPFTQWTRAPFVLIPETHGDPRAIALDERNRVWVGTSKGLFRIEKGELAAVPGMVGPVYRLEGHSVTGVWIGAWDGVYRWLDGEVRKLEGLDGPITAMQAGGTGMMVANPEGLYRWENGWKKLPVPAPKSIRAILPAAKGNYELLGTDVGLFECDGPNAKQILALEPAQSSRVVRDLLSFQAVRASPLRGLWVATNFGIDHFPPRSQDATAQGVNMYRAFPGESHTATVKRLPANDIRRLAHAVGTSDSQDAVWAATNVGLVQILREGETRLFHSQRWIPTDDVRDVVVAPDHSVWILTSGGVSHLIPRTLVLEDKARYFEEMIDARHVRPPGLVERCQLTRVGDLSSFRPVDTDNDGEYTGTYLAAQAFRYAATGSAEAKKKAKASFEAMAFLEEVSGKTGFIARTVIPSTWTEMADANRSHTPIEVAEMLAQNAREKVVERRWRLSADREWLWKGDTSSDEVTGHFYAYDIFHELVASPEEKEEVKRLVCRVMDRILADGLVLKDEDGTATLWGVWSPEKLNDDPNWSNERGVNSVEILSYLTTAFWISGDPKYDQKIEELLTKHHYADNILEPRPFDLGTYTYIDDELLAMAYWGLLRHERRPDRKALYRKSLEAWFRTVERDASPLYNFTYAVLTGESPAKYRRDESLALLRDVPLDMIHWSIDNTRRMDIRLVNSPQAERVQTDRLLPPSETPVLRWDNNPYVAAGGEGGTSEMCPAFWLWPYWMGRWQRIVGEVTR